MLTLPLSKCHMCSLCGQANTQTYRNIMTTYLIVETIPTHVDDLTLTMCVLRNPRCNRTGDWSHCYHCYAVGGHSCRGGPFSKHRHYSDSRTSHKRSGFRDTTTLRLVSYDHALLDISLIYRCNKPCHMASMTPRAKFVPNQG